MTENTKVRVYEERLRELMNKMSYFNAAEGKSYTNERKNRENTKKELKELVLRVKNLINIETLASSYLISRSDYE